MRIAVDAMGGDHAPARIVDGALAAARHLGHRLDLVGRRPSIAGRADAAPRRSGRWTCASSMRPTSSRWPKSPAQALRRKPGASIRVAADLVARREAAALVSAGHTGATVVAAHAAFGMLPGVDRPALAPSMPTRVGSAVLIDAGATVECKPALPAAVRRHGRGLRARLDGHRSPARRAVVDWRRSQQGQRADARRAPAAQGLVAAASSATSRRATSSRAGPTSIVCDGFTGNVALKLSEGLVEMVEDLLGEELQSTFSAQMGLSAVAAGVPALSASVWTIPSTAAHR